MAILEVPVVVPREWEEVAIAVVAAVAHKPLAALVERHLDMARSVWVAPEFMAPAHIPTPMVPVVAVVDITEAEAETRAPVAVAPDTLVG